MQLIYSSFLACKNWTNLSSEHRYQPVSSDRAEVSNRCTIPFLFDEDGFHLTPADMEERRIFENRVARKW
jgi:hypothetical protein